MNQTLENIEINPALKGVKINFNATISIPSLTPIPEGAKKANIPINPDKENAPKTKKYSVQEISTKLFIKKIAANPNKNQLIK